MAKSPPDPPVSLSARQLAEVLGVNRATIARALAAGKPLGGWRPLRVGDRIKFIREDPTTTQTP